MPLTYTHKNIRHQFTRITFQNNKTPAFNQYDSSHTGETKRHKYEIPSAEQKIRDCMYESSFSTQSHSPGLCRLSLSENKRHASQILMHSSINLSSHQNLSTQNFLWNYCHCFALLYDKGLLWFVVFKRMVHKSRATRRKEEPLLEVLSLEIQETCKAIDPYDCKT